MDELPATSEPRSAAIEQALSEPSVASLLANSAPVFVAVGTPPAVVFANPAARVFFANGGDLAALAARLFGSPDPGSRRLMELVGLLKPGAPARLEKLRFTLGRRIELLTCLCRRVDGAEPLLVVGVLGARVPNAASVPTAVVAPSAAILTPASDAHANSNLASLHEPEPVGPKSFQRTAADVAQRFANASTVRFLWRSDASGHLVEITGQLCEVVGCDSGALIGRDFGEQAERSGADPDRRLAAALRRRDTWSGLELLWPISGADACAPISLGALPSFDRTGVFDGFRGFGVIHLRRLAPLPTRQADSRSQAARAAVEDDAEPQALVPMPEAPIETETSAASLAPAMAEPIAAVVEASEESDHAGNADVAQPDNVVSLHRRRAAPIASSRIAGVEPPDMDRPSSELLNQPDQAEQAPASAEAPKASAPETEPDLPRRDASQSRLVELTPAERRAFSDIAIALGAKPIDEEQRAAKARAARDRAGGPEVGQLPSEADAAPATPEPKSPASEPVPAASEAPAAPAPFLDDEHDALDRDEPQVAPPRPRSGRDVLALSSPEDVAAPRLIEPLPRSAPAEILAGPVGADAAQEPISADAAVSDVSRNAAKVLERLPLGVLVSRLETPIYLNRALLDMLGYASADAFHDAGGLDRLFQGHRPDSMELESDGATVPVATASGVAIPVEGRLQTIEWDGAPATLMTFRKPAERAHIMTLESELRQAESLNNELHAILDTATDGVAVLDRNGRILSLNRSAEALFGYEQNEVAGEPFNVLLAPESHAAASDYFEGLKSDGVASLLNDGREAMGRARKGGSIPVFMTLGRLGATGGKFCAVMRDMTHWKNAERELRDARSEAERASQLKSDFLAKISHEIRTPLNAILGFAEVIMEERFGPVGNQRYKDYLKDIHASGGHVMSLVNDLLDLSKIEAGKLDLNFGAVDANRIFAECVSLIQPQATVERVIVRSSLSPRLPKIVADERSLRQIALNLLSNAVKFNEPGGQVIVSSALTEAGNVVLRIKDTGVGMSEAEVQMALEPFRQIQTSRSSGGTGLGLPLTKALVEANRASFVIRSKKREGTLVEVSFPSTRVLAE